MRLQEDLLRGRVENIAAEFIGLLGASKADVYRDSTQDRRVAQEVADKILGYIESRRQAGDTTTGPRPPQPRATAEIPAPAEARGGQSKTKPKK